LPYTDTGGFLGCWVPLVLRWVAAVFRVLLDRCQMRLFVSRSQRICLLMLSLISVDSISRRVVLGVVMGAGAGKL